MMKTNGKMKNKTFREWFFQDYLMQSSISSQLLIGNKSISERQERICQVAELILSKDTNTIDNIRKDIIIKFFISSRCALDYINYATLFINVYHNYTLTKNRKV
jgi:hypothetical protein